MAVNGSGPSVIHARSKPKPIPASPAFESRFYGAGMDTGNAGAGATTHATQTDGVVLGCAAR